MSSDQKAVVHISFDYPDSLDSKKTKAVSNLVNAQTSYRNIVFSLNRSANPFDDFSFRKEPHGYSLKIFGLPFGIGLRIWMKLAARKIEKVILNEKIDLCLIHGHKLTFEGLIAHSLSKKLSIPYMVSLRGDTDLKLIKIQRFNRGIFLKTLQKARKTIFLAPWTQKEIQKIYKGKLSPNSSLILPNIIELSNTTEYPSEKRFTDTFVTVFHLDSYKRKNIKRTIAAMDAVHSQYPHLKLDIIGGGKSEKIIQSYIRECKYPSHFRLVGSMDHKEVLAIYNKYLGLILPSFPETFGLVFVEALHSGIPVLYSKNSGIDGFFDSLEICEKVKHDSIQEIKTGIIKIYQNNSKHRESIQHLKSSNGFQKFSKETISDQYTRIVASLAS